MSAFRRAVSDQRVRFLAIGGVNTGVGFGLYTLFALLVFDDVPFGYLWSLGLSYAIAIVLAFVLYRRFVFPVRGHVLRDFARFVGVYAVSISINAVLLPLLIEIAGVLPIAAQAVALVATTILSFLGHKLFSFRRSPHEVARAAPPQRASSRVMEQPEGSPEA